MLAGPDCAFGSSHCGLEGLPAAALAPPFVPDTCLAGHGPRLGGAARLQLQRNTVVYIRKLSCQESRWIACEQISGSEQSDSRGVYHHIRCEWLLLGQCRPSPGHRCLM